MIESRWGISWFVFSCFFFNDTATTEIYTLSLHDALPIFERTRRESFLFKFADYVDHLALASDHRDVARVRADGPLERSEEHTSELQSRQYLVCRLLLEKKKLT